MVSSQGKSSAALGNDKAVCWERQVHCWVKQSVLLASFSIFWLL